MGESIPGLFEFIVHVNSTKVNGDKTTGKWLPYMMYFYPRTTQSLFWVQGFYNMEYVRENEEWKINLYGGIGADVVFKCAGTPQAA
jgi:hypothetical protein